MNERTEDHEQEHTEQDPSYEEETAKETSTRSKTDNEMKDYQEVISAIESIMKDENISVSEKNSPNLVKTKIGKILSFLNKEINEERNLTEAWLIKGTVFYKTGKYESAVAAFNSALEIISKEIPDEDMRRWQETSVTNFRYALKLKALALFRLGRYIEALDMLNGILEVYPDDSEVQQYRSILFTLEDENLISELNILPYNYPESSINWEDRGISLYELDEFETALQEFDKGLEINPHDANIWGYKGAALYRLGRYEEALEAFEKSLEINPKNARIWSFKGSTLYILNRPEAALKAFDKALQKNPNILEAWFNKGSILFVLGKYRQSLSAVENVLRINPREANAQNLKSSILDKLEQKKKSYN